ncbi:MAG: serpin family protein [Prevotella sp.]|nr:serpin family protein [Prevotella sp.]
MKKTMMMGVAVALMTVSCSLGDPAGNQLIIDPPAIKGIPLSTSERQLVSNNNDFAFNLFRQLNASESGSGQLKSMMVSPLSITYALGMLNNGASGETRQQINKALGLNDVSEANAFYKKMMTQAPLLEQTTKLLLANTIYVNKPHELKPVFVEALKNYYGAEPEARDFRDGQTLNAINQWASNHTEQMIDHVLDEDEFDPTAVSYLLNAIYFKGTWTWKFDEKNTVEDWFNDGGPKVPMMHQRTTLNHIKTADYEALLLPYGTGAAHTGSVGAFNMTILLPRDGKTVNEVLSGLTGKSWQDLWMVEEGKKVFYYGLVDVKLPRFESKTDIHLETVLKSLGMPNMFSPELAEFTDFCQEQTHVGMMKQVARVKVNEEGAEASAVTVGGFFNTSVPDEPSFIPFHANRPFLYIISEFSTNAIFFIGQYMGE